jgi:hypothetical protein
MAGFADAVLGSDGVGTQEYAVKAHPLQRRLGQGPTKLRLRLRSRPSGSHLDALRFGQLLHSVDAGRGCRELFEAAQLVRRGTHGGPGEVQHVLPGPDYCRRAAGLLANWERD